MDRVSNARIRALCGVQKGLDETIDEGVLRWFGHMENDRIVKRVYVGKWAGSRSVGRPRKRCLDVRQARRMAGVCEGESMGRSPGDELLTWTRCHSCWLSQLHEACEVWNSFCG